MFVDDQCPLVRVGNREDRVPASGNVSSRNRDEAFISDKRSGLISSGPPDLSVGHQFAKDIAAFHTRAGVIYSDRLSARKFALGLCRRTGTFALILLTVGSDTGSDDEQNCKSCLYQHQHPPLPLSMLNLTVVLGPRIRLLTKIGIYYTLELVVSVKAIFRQQRLLFRLA